VVERVVPNARETLPVAERFKALRSTWMPESLEGFRYPTTVAERFKALRPGITPESLEGFRYGSSHNPFTPE
jgi:hypothetical protein